VTQAPPDRPASVRPVQYKGESLDSQRGPGLGCFRFQLALLAVLIVLTPLSVAWSWPSAVSAALLFAVIILLLFAGQTIIFLLRLVAADRRAGRRRPLASQTKTVGELEDESGAEGAVTSADGSAGGAGPRGGDEPRDAHEPLDRDDPLDAVEPLERGRPPGRGDQPETGDRAMRQ
jgi:hypothetical protein